MMLNIPEMKLYSVLDYDIHPKKRIEMYPSGMKIWQSSVFLKIPSLPLCIIVPIYGIHMDIMAPYIMPINMNESHPTLYKPMSFNLNESWVNIKGGSRILS